MTGETPRRAGARSAYGPDDMTAMLFGDACGTCRVADPRDGHVNEPAVRQAWDALGDELLAAWLAAYPCSRPFAWWTVGGHVREFRGTPREMAAAYKAAPFQLQWRWGRRYMGHEGGRLLEFYPLASFESQASYLERMGLLTAAERAHLAEHPELLQADDEYQWTDALREALN